MDLEHVQPVQSLTPDRRSRRRTVVTAAIPVVVLVAVVAAGSLGNAVPDRFDTPPDAIAQLTPSPDPTASPPVAPDEVALRRDVVAIHDGGYPLRALGLTVRSVARTIELRATGEITGEVVAVAGWLSIPPERDCGTDVVDPGHGQYGSGSSCRRGTILTDAPGAVVGFDGSQTFMLGKIAGGVLNPQALPGISLAPIAAGQARGKTVAPQRAVVLGRFSDARLPECASGEPECFDRFALERVIWLDGDWRLRRPELYPTAADADVSRTVRWPTIDAAIPRGIILSEVVAPRSELARLDPQADRAVPFDDVGTIWYVRALLRPRGGGDPDGEVAWAVIEDATGFVLAADPDRRSASALE